MNRISVVICTHQNSRFKDFLEAVNSIKNQTYKNFEIIGIVDGNDSLFKKLKSKKVLNKLSLNKNNLGLSKSRNKGIEKASGNIIAFLDDDAIADRNWLKELERMYKKYNAIAVGGRLIPKWVTKKPNFLPEEYYWLIGATHKSFPEKVTEVRNTFGSNISFKTDILKVLEGFRNEIGVKGKKLLQAEETELCERMREKFGKGVIYNPGAIVYHKIFPERLRLTFLLRRAFWQGYSKRIMKEEGCALKEENTFLKEIFNGVFERIAQIITLFILTSTVLIGYLFKGLKKGVKTK